MSSKKSNKSWKAQKSIESKAGSLAVSSDKPSASLKSRELLYYAGLILVLILAIVIRMNLLGIPFERDEGAYAYSGKQILEGAVPYVDIGSQRLDGVFYAYALIVWIFGYAYEHLHFAFLIINLVNTTLLYFFTRKLVNSITAISASAFFVLLSVALHVSGFSMQSEHLVVLFALSAFIVLFRYFDTQRIIWLVFAGILFSIAFQIKQTSFFFGVLGGILVLINNAFVKKESIWNHIKLATIFSISVFVPILIDLFVVYQRGAWNDFMLWFFDIREHYTSIIPFEQGKQRLITQFSEAYKDYEYFWIISFIGTISVFLSDLSLLKKSCLFGLFIAGFMAIVPGWHFYGHYFLQWTPAVCISGAAMIYTLQYRLNKMNFKTFAAIVPVLFMVLPVFQNLNNLKKYYFKPNYTQLLRTMYGLNPFPESKVIADKLNSVMNENDQIAVLGTEMQMYVYTNKKSPSRFAGSGVLLEFPVEQHTQWQKEFIADVEKAKPRFLIFFHHAISWMAHPKAENLIFPWFYKYSAANYKPFGYADIYDNTTNYVWAPKLDFVNNPPKSQYRVYIYERL